MLIFPVHPQTKARLLKLLNGNTGACERLINKIKSENFDMNEQCCYSKAIKDLNKS